MQIEAAIIPFICGGISESSKANWLHEAIDPEVKPLVDAAVFPSVTGEPAVSLLIGSDRLRKVTQADSEVRWVSDNRALIPINTKTKCTLQGTYIRRGTKWTVFEHSYLRPANRCLLTPLTRQTGFGVRYYSGIEGKTFPKQDIDIRGFNHAIDFRNGCVEVTKGMYQRRIIRVLPFV